MHQIGRRQRRLRGALIAGAIAAVVAACEKPAPVPAADTPARPAEPPAPAAVSVSPAQFAQLRWLEGRWRGEGGGVPPFFEGYRWADDSTIRKYDFADSTFSAPTDSGDVQLRAGQVRNGSPRQSWVAVALDSVSIRFAPERGATNGFEWRRGAAGSWTARLTWDSAGVPRERVYEMRAAGKAPTRQ